MSKHKGKKPGVVDMGKYIERREKKRRIAVGIAYEEALKRPKDDCASKNNDDELEALFALGRKCAKEHGITKEKIDAVVRQIRVSKDDSCN